jgi:hypothetical protein
MSTLKEFCQKAEKYNGTEKQFCEIFTEGCELLNLSFADKAKYFSCNTAEQFKKTAPPNIFRYFIVARLQHLVLARI